MYDHIPHLIDMDALLVNARSALPNAPQVEPVVRFARTRIASAALLARVATRLDRASERVAPARSQACVSA
ncbi:MAG: hypothetical protein PSX37_06890 [bacterium]|nr:hypothetical protein [bacterium]